ncbi:hypothetical protein [Pseudonocardia sp.]|uniref:hypothetical protein n=1 Tax=Pseudonocardia sp. TaxID=60912 RepID=UPI00261B8EE0|nr:hypothetical protein [Pseudonocardia sp.]
MAGDRSALTGLLFFLVVAAAPTVVFWIALRLLPAAWARFDERRRRNRMPLGPSLQTVVSDVRRLRLEIRTRPQHTQLRRVALLAAYDDALLDACRVAGVPDPPLGAAADRDRAFARLLTEAALEDAGIALDPPRGGAAAA